jgi:hypothetical protein
VSVTLTWRDTQVGGDFLLKEGEEAMLSASVNRPTLGGRLTDVNWYLERLREPLAKVGTVEEWSWKESASGGAPNRPRGGIAAVHHLRAWTRSPPPHP